MKPEFFGYGTVYLGLSHNLLYVYERTIELIRFLLQDRKSVTHAVVNTS